MGFFDSLTGTISRGLEAVGGFAQDVLSRGVPILAETLIARATNAAAPRGSGGVVIGMTPGTASRMGGIPTFSGVPLATGLLGELGGGGIIHEPRDFSFPLSRSEVMPVPNFAMPGGAPIQQAGLLGSGFASGIGSALGSFFGSGGGEGAVATVQALRDMRTGVAPGGVYRVQGARLVARRLIRVTNPSTGNDTYYRNVGQPILFRGDLRVCKTVEKVARLARRVSRKR